MSLSNRQKLDLLREKKRREKAELYKHDFEAFARDHIQIITKDSSRGFINFELNEPQRVINNAIEKQLKETGKVRAIILKARQQGISTYSVGRVFWKTYYNQYTRSVVMAHDSATSDALFTMSKNLIKNMDASMRPEEQKSNAKEIILHSPAYDDKEATGSYRLYTAGSPEAGRGTTPTIAHLSEVAFWTHDEKILAGLFQGISQADGTEVILESTANGATGEFYRLWRGAVDGTNGYIPIFVPWYLTSEYQLPIVGDFELTSEEEELREKVQNSEWGITLSDEQLYWRRLKIGESGPRKFQQEYPAFPEEAFLVSGANVFDMSVVNEMAPSMPERKLRFNDAYGTWDEDRDGELEVWIPPHFNESYVIGADVSLGANQDYSVATVFNTDRQLCAMYRINTMDPGTYGDILFYLGRYYNNALLCVESNSIGNTTLDRLMQMQYLNLYYETKVAQMRTESTTRLGFRTTAASKPRVIGHLKRLIEDRDISLPSNIIIQELKDYIANDSGKTEAMSGCHDDTIMSVAISMEVLRTHSDKLNNKTVSWKEKTGNIFQEETQWL